MRVTAIDIFRALTMLAMLWVNDFAGLDNIPHWLEHAAVGEDMLGLSDLVFPAFLFVMGASTPFALSARVAREGVWRTILHVVSRTAALLVMGLYTVNYENFDWEAMNPVPRPVWTILMVVAFFLIWAKYPKGARWKALAQCAGVAILILLYNTFSGDGGSDFGVRWWGILGLIGWSYAVSAAVWMVARGKLWLNALAVVAAVAACIVWQGRATLFAFSVTGLFVAALVGRGSTKLLYGVIGACIPLMTLAGNAAHRTWIVSKLGNTPTWYFYSTAIFLAIFAVIHSLSDGRGKTRMPGWLSPAGRVTLTCYVIPYFWYSVYWIAGVQKPEFLSSGLAGLVGSALFAFLVVQLAGLMDRRGVRLKV